MRKFFITAIIALITALAVTGADAQVRMRPVLKPGVMMKVPRVNPVKPKIVVIPPSGAIGRALRIMPGSKAIGVRLKGQTYIVRLKSGGTIAQIGVNSVTGATSPLP